MISDMCGLWNAYLNQVLTNLFYCKTMFLTEEQSQSIFLQLNVSMFYIVSWAAFGLQSVIFIKTIGFQVRSGCESRWASQGALVVKNPSATAGGVRDVGSISGWERSPGGGHDQPTPVFFPGKSHGQRGLAGLLPTGSRRVRHNWSDLAHIGFRELSNRLYSTWHCARR